MDKYTYFFSFFAEKDGVLFPGSAPVTLDEKISRYKHLDNIARDLESKLSYDAGSLVVMNFQLFENED